MPRSTTVADPSELRIGRSFGLFMLLDFCGSLELAAVYLFFQASLCRLWIYYRQWAKHSNSQARRQRKGMNELR